MLIADLAVWDDDSTEKKEKIKINFSGKVFSIENYS